MHEFNAAAPWFDNLNMRPYLAPGYYFRRRGFQDFKKLPPLLHWHGASWFDFDDGVMHGQMAHVIMAIDQHRNLHVVDAWSKACSTVDAIDAMFMLAEGLLLANLQGIKEPTPGINHGVQRWHLDHGQAKAGIEGRILAAKQAIRGKSKERDVRHLLFSLEPTRLPVDVMSAARLLQAEIEAGTLLFPPEYGVADDLKSELAMWPASRSMSHLGALLVLVTNRDRIGAPYPQSGDWDSPKRRGTAWSA